MSSNHIKKYLIHSACETQQLFSTLLKFTNDHRFQTYQLQLISYNATTRTMVFMDKEDTKIELIFHINEQNQTTIDLSIESDACDEIKQRIIQLLQECKSAYDMQNHARHTSQNPWLQNLKNNVKQTNIVVHLLRICSVVISIYGIEIAIKFAKVPKYMNVLFSKQYIGSHFSISVFFNILFPFLCTSLLFYAVAQILHLNYEKLKLMKSQETLETNDAKQNEHIL